MGPITKLKLGLVGVICVGVGAMSLRAYFYGEGWIHVMFPADDIGKLMVDGVEVKAHQPRNRTHTFLVKQGKHQISVERPSGARASYTLDVKSGWAFMVVPVDDQQCFAQIDVTKSRYGRGSEPAKVVARYTSHQPADVPDCPSFGVENLPPTIKGDEELLQDFPCSMAALSDDELLKALGE
jgi:hypothetical protein